MVLPSECSTPAVMPVMGGHSAKTEIREVYTSPGTMYVVGYGSKRSDLEKGLA